MSSARYPQEPDRPEAEMSFRGESPPPVEDRFRNTGKALVQVRQALGLSQTAVARRAGVTKSQLSKYESGREKPRLTSLNRILAALDLSPALFFYVVYVFDCLEGALGRDERSVLLAPLSPLAPDSSFLARLFARLLDDYLSSLVVQPTPGLHEEAPPQSK